MISINDILKAIPFVEFIGNKEQKIKNLVQTDDINSSETNLCWCSDKNIQALKNMQRGTVICSTSTSKDLLNNKSCNYIVVENPRFAFKKVIENFFIDKEILYEIDSSAHIHSSVILGKQVKIGQNVVVEENSVIGEMTVIGANTVILKGTKIGQKVKIGCNNTIGGIGFGYEKNDNNEYELIPHIGNVLIHDHVEIGNNVTIDRAVLGSTILHKNVKVDNLVHIAHGVEIGENSLIIANAMIAGSVKIGKNVWVAPSSSIMNKRSLGDNSVIGMGAVVLKDVAEKDVIIGNPGKKLDKNG
jgi:UDP-3-O-[3-hydroxymyristoyl] glucosamine N-acyltransferase